MSTFIFCNFIILIILQFVLSCMKRNDKIYEIEVFGVELPIAEYKKTLYKIKEGEL